MVELLCIVLANPFAESPPTSRRVSPRRDGTLQGQKSSSPLRNGARSSPPVPPPNESIDVPTITNVTENENQPTETTATSATAKDAQAGPPPDVPESAPKSALQNTTEPVSEPAPEPALEEASEELIRKSPEQQSVHAPEPSPEQLPHDVLNSTDVAITEPELELGGEPDSNQAQPKSPLSQQAAPQPNGTSSPADSTRSKRKRGTSANERSSPSASPRPASESTQQVPRIPTPEQPVDASIAAEGKRRGASTRARSSQSASPKILDQDIQPQAPDPEEPPDAPTDKRTTRGASASGRPSKSASPRSVGESVQQPPQAATLDQPLETSTSKGKTRGASTGTRSTQSGSPEIGGEASQQAKQTPQTEVSQKATRGKRKRRGSSASRRSPQSATALETAEEIQHPPPEELQDTPMEAEPSELQPAKRRGRPQGSTQRSPVSGEDADAAAAPPVDKSAKEPSPPRREPRGLRNRNAKKAMPQVAAQEEEEPVAEPAQVEGASEANATNHEEGRQPRQKLKTADKKSRRAGRGDKKAQAEEMSEEVPRPGRKGKTARRTQEPEPEPEPERAPERQPEVEPEAEPEPAPESQPEPSTRKHGRGKPSQLKRDSQATQPEERATQDNVEETAAPRPQRKPRQPRGETVPVTVHRLANVASLGGALPGTSSDEDEDEDDQETTEELSTRLKAKLPNRGGVNVADVLSQICRETLEKTLTTLNNGIANEGNAARRSEWTRKKKAVEAYGTELEGRLFELSEMLDSNFVLGVQLRKAKREMLDQRTRLFRLRKEREAVALRMDVVRQKHTEEENARAVSSLPHPYLVPPSKLTETNLIFRLAQQLITPFTTSTSLSNETNSTNLHPPIHPPPKTPRLLPHPSASNSSCEASPRTRAPGPLELRAVCYRRSGPSMRS